MKTLTFQYNSASPSSEEKKQFEERVNEKYESIIDLYNKEGGIVMVSYDQQKKLRGVFAASKKVFETMRLNGLRTEFEFK